MKPLKDRILVFPIKEEQTKSGLFIPGGSQKNNKGKVVLVSDRVTHIKVDDIVLHHEHVGETVNYNGIEHLMLRTSDRFKHVIAVVDQKNPRDIINKLY